MLKNLNKAFDKHLERDWLLEKIKVFNQDLSICRNTCTTLVLKLVIDFITFWDDPMQDGSVTIINVFELCKQTALINADKIYAVSDDCRKWEGRIYFFCEWIKNQKKLKISWNKLFFSRLWFLLNPLQTVAFLCPPESILIFSWGIERKLLTEMG